MVRLIEQFETIGSIQTKKRHIHVRAARSAENIAAVSESVEHNSSTSIRHRSQQLRLSRSSLQRILAKDLHFHAYKIRLTQYLKTADHAQQRNHGIIEDKI